MEGIVPLYYEMGKAKAEKITKENIYTSLVNAFKYNNIGKFSNQLTVMWNLNEIDLTTIKQIAALNNFTIDAAKTLLMPEVPSDVAEKMRVANGKMPYFFQFTKDKDESDVSYKNESTVNRICDKIESIKQGTYDFSTIGKFNKNMLMNNSRIEIDDDVINKYKYLEKEKNIIACSSKMRLGEVGSIITLKNIKDDFDEYIKGKKLNKKDCVDMVVKYIYSTNRNSRKEFLFDLFGNEIYESLINNITKPLSEYVMCEVCGERVENTNGKTIYCEHCAREIKRENDKIRMREIRKCSIC